MSRYIDKVMLSTGKTYEGICKIPLIGSQLARLLNRNIGRLIYYMPGTGAGRIDTCQGIKDYLIKGCEVMGFPFEFIPESEEPDSFEYYVTDCPYGFKRPDQEVPCDAAMDMDRQLFKLMGWNVTIKESAVHGAPKCLIHIERRQ
jgi:hypothetical protein